MSGLGAPLDDGGHRRDDLPALAAGTLALTEVRLVVGHLRACDPCRRELVEVVGATAALALLRDVEEAGADDLAPDGEVLLPPLVLDKLTPVSVPGPDGNVDDASRATTPHRPRRRRAVVAGAAVALVAAVLVVSVALSRRSGPSSVGVALQPIGVSTGTGRVTMTTSGLDRTMTVDAQLMPPSQGSFYEVWLLNQVSGRMVSVGVLPDDGKAKFSLPAELLTAYDTVDVSLEPDDGVPAHSGDSVLRANYGPTA